MNNKSGYVVLINLSSRSAAVPASSHISQCKRRGFVEYPLPHPHYVNVLSVYRKDHFPRYLFEGSNFSCLPVVIDVKEVMQIRDDAFPTR